MIFFSEVPSMISKINKIYVFQPRKEAIMAKEIIDVKLHIIISVCLYDTALPDILLSLLPMCKTINDYC